MVQWTGTSLIEELVSCVLSMIYLEDVLINVIRNPADDGGNETPALTCSHFQGTEKKCTSQAKLFVAELGLRVVVLQPAGFCFRRQRRCHRPKVSTLTQR